MFEEFNVKNCKIKLVEKVTCQNKEKMFKKEREWPQDRMGSNKFL